jgi:predicted  nucleic acid-binding Zn-ribbon protein
MWLTRVKSKYEIVAMLPSEDKPPANIALMIKQCQSVGREDLAHQIQMQWSKVLHKYPAARLNWPAATKIGGASIKKNIFEGKEFVVWLKAQEDLSPEQRKEAKEIPSVVPLKGVPAIAIPKDNETPEDWKNQAAKTKEQLAEAKKGFSDIREYIKFLETEVVGFQKKIETYGPGGPKALTKGKPSKLSLRVPKWQELMKVTAQQLAETKASLAQVESQFKTAVSDYNTAPITTVDYEKNVQANVENILEYVLNLKDLNKQRELLEKLNSTLDKQKVGASVDEVTAEGDRFTAFFANIKTGFNFLKKWIQNLNKSVVKFNQLASLRY